MIEVMISSSVLILAICLVRFLLRGRVSPGYLYGLWGLAALRLVLPWLYPLRKVFGSLKSRFSVMNAAYMVRTHVFTGTRLEPLTDSGVSGHVYHVGEGAAPLSAVQKAPGIDWQLWIAVIWMAGTLILAFWMAAVTVHFYRKLIWSRRLYKGQLPDFVTKYVYIVDGLASPCYFGMGMEHAIYLPETMADDEDKVRHALAHEMGHVRHGDRVWGILRCILLCYYWMNPFVWLAAVLSRRDCELACDDAAVKLLGEEERFAYGRTLVGLAEEQKDQRGLFSMAMMMGTGKRTLQERIQVLSKHPGCTAAMGAVLAAVTVALAACTFTGSIEADVTAAGVSESASGTYDNASAANKNAAGIYEDAAGANGSAAGANGSAVGTDRSAAGTDKNAAGANGSAAEANESAVGTDRSAAGTDKNAEGANKNAVGTNESAVGTDKSAAGANESAVGTDKSAAGANESAVGTDRSAAGTDKNAEGANGSAVGANENTAGADKNAAGASESAAGTDKNAARTNESAAGAKKSMKKSSGISKDKIHENMILVNERQYGTLYILTLECGQKETKEAYSVLTDPELEVELAFYKDKAGTKLLGDGASSYGYSYAVTGTGMEVEILNAQHAASFRITAGNDQTEFEYLFVTHDQESLEKPILKKMKIFAHDGSSLTLHSAEVYPNMVHLRLAGETEEAVKQFQTENILILKLLGKDGGKKITESRERYEYPQQRWQNGNTADILYCLEEEISSVNDLEAIIAGNGKEWQEYVGNRLDYQMIREMAENFKKAYMTGDRKEAEQYLGFSYDRLESYPLNKLWYSKITNMHILEEKPVLAEVDYIFQTENEADGEWKLRLWVHKAYDKWKIERLEWSREK